MRIMMNKMKFRLMTLFIAALFFSRVDAANWPQWRGGNRDGIVTGKPWPADLKGQPPKLKWRIELESSYSSPILDGDTVYVTESAGKNEAMRALERKTGK